MNAGWSDYQRALDANGKSYTMHMYEGANHGFHNDTTPRYDEAAARLCTGADHRLLQRTSA